MTMNFFEHQDQVHRKTRLLILGFCVVLIVFSICNTLLIGIFLQLESLRSWLLYFFCMLAATLFLMGVTNLIMAYRMRSGHAVARMLGGNKIHHFSSVPEERRLLNIISEMSIASGVPVPTVYVLDHEYGINAFAAGYESRDTVIGITYGALHLLSREQLQGVIAHEFSHILHGDIRLNMRLSVWLTGVLAPSLILLFWIRGFELASENRRLDAGEKLGLLEPEATPCGWIRMITGLGLFSGTWIKAKISREREFLADASAVQFTRNPGGIAGALSAIKQVSWGSFLRNRQTEITNHFFLGDVFDKAESYSQLSFATHPPLSDRIHRIDPTFQGKTKDVSFAVLNPVPLTEDEIKISQIRAGTFVPFTASESSLKNLMAEAGSGDALASTFSSPHLAALARHTFDHAGETSSEHLAYASILINSWPETILEATQEPLGACALIYCLLLDPSPEIAAKQWTCLESSVTPAYLKETARLQKLFSQLGRETYLPLLEMTLPALSELSEPQHSVFQDTLSTLIKVDNQVSLFEYALYRIVSRHLEKQREQGTLIPEPSRFFVMKHHLLPCAGLLATLAHQGNSDSKSARHAYNRGARKLRIKEDTFKLWPAEKCGPAALDAALDSLKGTHPRMKQRLLRALAACVLSDRKTTLTEVELLRTIAMDLEIPIPPIVPQPAEAEA